MKIPPLAMDINRQRAIELSVRLKKLVNDKEVTLVSIEESNNLLLAFDDEYQARDKADLRIKELEKKISSLQSEVSVQHPYYMDKVSECHQLDTVIATLYGDLLSIKESVKSLTGPCGALFNKIDAALGVTPKFISAREQARDNIVLWARENDDDGNQQLEALFFVLDAIEKKRAPYDPLKKETL